MKWSKFRYHWRGDCFSLYKDFFNLHYSKTNSLCRIYFFFQISMQEKSFYIKLSKLKIKLSDQNQQNLNGWRYSPFLKVWFPKTNSEKQISKLAMRNLSSTIDAEFEHVWWSMRLSLPKTNCGTLMPQPKCSNTNCSSGSGSKINHTHTPTNCCSLPCLLVVVKISPKSRSLLISCSTTQWCQACLNFSSALSSVEIVRDLWTRSLFHKLVTSAMDHTGKLGS